MKPMHNGNGENTGNILPAGDNGARMVVLFTLLLRATTAASLIQWQGVDKN